METKEIERDTLKTLTRHESEIGDTQHNSLDSSDNLDESSELTSRIKWTRAICPPRGWITKYLTWGIVMASFLGALWSIAPTEMSPHHDIFSLVITILLCIAAEQLVVKIPTPRGYPPLPPLFASLLMGLMLRNLPPPGNIALGINTNISSILRKLSLTVILTRAGLEIDPQAMGKLKWAVVRLAFSPCIVETTTIGILAHFILNFSLLWSFMLGFVIAAVSPAVVIPSLILLQQAGYGIQKGIPSLVMAASGIDDVLAITGFTILLGIAIPTGLEHDFISIIESLIYPSSPKDPPATTAPTMNTTFSGALNSTITFINATSQAAADNQEDNSDIGKEIGGAFIEVAIGVLSGVLLGLFIAYIPHKAMKYKTFCRGALLLTIGTFMVFATALWNIAGAGTLCALVMSFTASLKWNEDREPLAKLWYFMWIIFQPILFGLTGTLVDVTQMDGTTVGLGLAVLGLAMISRLLTSTAVTIGLGYNLKERLFVSIAWIPKGTVQAALCSAVLDQAIAQDLPESDIYHATQILVLAVLVTLITAPIGAFAISIAGPRLLSQSSENQSDESQHNSGFENGLANQSELKFQIQDTSDLDSGAYTTEDDTKSAELQDDTTRL